MQAGHARPRDLEQLLELLRDVAEDRDGVSFQDVAVSMLLAVTMPPLEVVPFANSASGAALTIFGLALIARDGLLVLFGLDVTGSVMIAAASVWLL